MDITATAKRNTLFCRNTGTALHGQEFHFSTMEPTIEDFPWAFHLEGVAKPQSYDGGYATDNVLASLSHLNPLLVLLKGQNILWRHVRAFWSY